MGLGLRIVKQFINPWWFQSSSVRGVGLGSAGLVWRKFGLEVSVLIGARRGARLSMKMLVKIVIFVSVLIGARRGARLCIPTFKHSKKSLISVLIGARRGARLSEGLCQIPGMLVSVLIGARCGARPDSLITHIIAPMQFQSSSVRGVGLGLDSFGPATMRARFQSSSVRGVGLGA